MCGITGILSHDRQRPAEAQVVGRMCDRLAHRGPDDRGIFAAGPVALGHRRLSILDLASGHQPMLSPDGRAVIVYNGEIYNYRELRAQLEGRGVRFRTRSDTEVVLAAYREYGEGFAEHLNGMFAIAIWDATTRVLLLVRDRLGIKPLYVFRGRECIAFASELKALRELPGFDSTWDAQAIHDYFQFLYVPEPRTVYRAVRRLEPGTLLVCEPNGEREVRYWDLQPIAVQGDSFTEPIEKSLKRAVRMQTVSDVPIGAFLSGGIDSGLIVASLYEALGEGVNTFTVYDPEVPFYDERRGARRVAEHYATRHTELGGAIRLESALDDIVECFDEPMGDSGALPNLVVCRESRRVATVALSGLGGDELAGGYLRYQGMLWTQAGRRVPGLLRRILAGAVDWLPEGRGLGTSRLRRLVRLIGLSEAESYSRMVTRGDLASRPLLDPALRREVNPEAPFEIVRGHLERAEELGLDLVNRLLYTDLRTYIPGDLLTVADRASMRVGLEVRVPFLDHELVAQALGVPGREKVGFRETKRLLRRIAQDRLPKGVVRGAKRGFSVPMAEWLRGPLAQEVEGLVEQSGAATEVLQKRKLRQLWEEHRTRRANHEDLLWATLVFGRWAQRVG